MIVIRLWVASNLQIVIVGLIADICTWKSLGLGFQFFWVFGFWVWVREFCKSREISNKIIYNTIKKKFFWFLGMDLSNNFDFFLIFKIYTQIHTQKIKIYLRRIKNKFILNKLKLFFSAFKIFFFEKEKKNLIHSYTFWENFLTKIILYMFI